MTQARNRRPQKETKLILHPFSTGTSEITYIKKIIEEQFKDIVILKDKSERNQHQIHSKDTAKTVDKIINEIKKTQDLIKKSEENYLLIITDLDNATLSQIQKLYKGTESPNTFFILNKIQFESWIKFYPNFLNNKKDENDKNFLMNKISNNWNDTFNNKHKQAKNNYFSETKHCKNNKCVNYDSLDEHKEYSDFPHFLNFLEKQTNIYI